MARPESLHTTFSPRPRQRVDAGPPQGALLVGIRAGPSGVLDDDDQVVEAGEPLRRHPKLIGVGHQLEQQVPLLQGPEHAGVGERPHVGAHRTDPSEARRCHLPVDELDGLGHRVGRRQTADDGVGAAAGASVVVELDGLLDRVPTGRGGDVDHLLDVPPGRLGPIGLDIEAAVHPRRVAGAAGRGM